jgi:hypothetical protein
MITLDLEENRPVLEGRLHRILRKIALVSEEGHPGHGG